LNAVSIWVPDRRARSPVTMPVSNALPSPGIFAIRLLAHLRAGSSSPRKVVARPRLRSIRTRSDAHLPSRKSPLSSSSLALGVATRARTRTTSPASAGPSSLVFGQAIRTRAPESTSGKVTRASDVEPKGPATGSPTTSSENSPAGLDSARATCSDHCVQQAVPTDIPAATPSPTSASTDLRRVPSTAVTPAASMTATVAVAAPLKGLSPDARIQATRSAAATPSHTAAANQARGGTEGLVSDGCRASTHWIWLSSGSGSLRSVSDVTGSRPGP
jgi:hypothetical protein